MHHQSLSVCFYDSFSTAMADSYVAGLNGVSIPGDLAILGTVCLTTLDNCRCAGREGNQNTLEIVLHRQN